jgi:hypothetical protein
MCTNGEIIDYVNEHSQKLRDILVKPAWSEEDKNMLQSILDEYKSMPTEKRNWLKSLRPQNRWKPSDVQMDAIKDAIDYLGENTKIVRKHLILLYGQLKKLKEG